MHILHNKIGVPKITEEKLEENISKFTLSPLPRGFGLTIANSMRRVALSSIPGSKVTGIKAKGVSHEYSTLPGVKDTILDIMLNLKGLIVEMNDSEPIWVELKKAKKGVVSASDINIPSGVKIINPDLYITEIDKDDLELDLQIRIQKGVGYLSVEDLKKDEDDVNVLLMDANFSPVISVKYDIDNTRVADMTNLDKIELTLKTNGVVSPGEAMKFSGAMLNSYFSLFNEEGLQVNGDYVGDVKELLKREKDEVQEELEKESYTPIEIMGLSPRTLNALINGNILSIEQLVKCTETKLSSIKGFGKKAMTEIRAALAERGLKLLGDD